MGGGEELESPWISWTAQADSTPSTTNCATNDTLPVYDHRFVATLTAAVVVTALLSIFGSGLIIFTYAAFKNLRTVAREILVQLSIADIIVALSHLVGIVVNLPKYIPKPCETPEEVVNDTGRDIACQVQGGATMFGTLSSFLWTIAVAVYLLTIIVFERQQFAQWLRWTFYPICWGIPLSLVLWFGLDDYLGFEESIDIGWCYVKWVNGTTLGRAGSDRYLMPQIVGYEIWLYLTFIVLPILYIWIRCYIRIKISQVHNKSAKLHAKAKMADFKLTFVPLIFLVLRMWGFILSIPHYYLPFSSKAAFRKTTYNAVLVLLAGIGSSAQGLMNSILFCACTPVVRKHLSSFLRRTICWPCRKRLPKLYALNHSPPTTAREMEDTTDYEEMDRDPTNTVCTLVVNADPHDSGPKSHLLSDNSPVTFNYQSITISSSMGKE